MIFVLYTSHYAQTYVTEDMIYGSVINAIKGIPKSTGNLSNYIYNTEIKKEKDFWWYWKKNNILQQKLKRKNIDYHTILKQGIYPKSVNDNTRETQMKKYAILTALAKMNNIETGEIIELEKEKQHKKKLNIEVKDIYELKKN